MEAASPNRGSASTDASPSKAKMSKNARKRSNLKEKRDSSSGISSSSSTESFNWRLELERVEKKWTLNSTTSSPGNGTVSAHASSHLSSTTLAGLSSAPKYTSSSSHISGAQFQEDEDSRVSIFATDIIDYLSPFLNRIKTCGGKFQNGLEEIHKIFATEVCQKHKEKTDRLKSHVLKVPKLFVAAIELDLPLSLILEFNSMEEDDPRVFQYRAHPLWGRSCVEFGAFLDRFDVNKEVICFIVWSTTQKACICLPNVSLNPYPLCWKCSKKFGLIKCQNCFVARYCGKECQIADASEHQPQCTEMHKMISKLKLWKF